MRLASARRAEYGAGSGTCLVSGIQPRQARVAIGPIQELLDFGQDSSVLRRSVNSWRVRWLRRLLWNLTRPDHGGLGQCLRQSEQLAIQLLGPVGQLLGPLHEFAGSFFEFFCCALKLVRITPPNGYNWNVPPLATDSTTKGGTCTAFSGPEFPRCAAGLSVVEQPVLDARQALTR
jgi:hypothetical protein